MAVVADNVWNGVGGDEVLAAVLVVRYGSSGGYCSCCG